MATVARVGGELLARRRAPAGVVGAILVGVRAMVLRGGVFHLPIAEEPAVSSVLLLSPIIAESLLLGLAETILRPRRASSERTITMRCRGR